MERITFGEGIPPLIDGEGRLEAPIRLTSTHPADTLVEELPIVQLSYVSLGPLPVLHNHRYTSHYRHTRGYVLRAR